MRLLTVTILFHAADARGDSAALQGSVPSLIPAGDVGGITVGSHSIDGAPNGLFFGVGEHGYRSVLTSTGFAAGDVMYAKQLQLKSSTSDDPCKIFVTENGLISSSCAVETAHTSP